MTTADIRPRKSAPIARAKLHPRMELCVPIYGCKFAVRPDAGKRAYQKMARQSRWRVRVLF
jgi:hypothetical protein